MKKFTRNIYLQNKDLNDAIDILKSNLSKKMKSEIVDVCDSLDRFTAKPVFAKVSSPYYNSSAMDGICVCYEKTILADDKNPITLKEGIDFEYVNTGNVIEKPFDAVIMIEDIVEIERNLVQIFMPASPWQHIRNIGEDIVSSELIVPAYHMIRPVDIGALIAGGLREIEVISKPIVAIIPTGTEIIDYSEDVEVGKILDSNSRMFEALVTKAGGISKRYKPIKDDYDTIKNTVVSACKESDIVVIGAGSSAGSKDYTKQIIEDVGHLLFHGVAIKPGKPTIVGKYADKLIFGIPGYPVSSYFSFSLFVIPAINAMLHTCKNKKAKVKARLTTRVYSALKHQEFIRMKLGCVFEQLVATPLSRGAGVTMSLVEADGILSVPKNSEGFEANEEVEIELLKDLENINNTLVSVGSHDIALDMLNNLMHLKQYGINLTSTHVGSMGGIIAFKRDKCHIAPIHLLDEISGEYNIIAVEKYLSDKDCVLVKGVKRLQGLMVCDDNKGIKSISDLNGQNILFVNRQKGSGTRLLVDYLIKKEGIDAKEIEGYNRELNTHMMVASAVKSASADVGVGVLSAANAMGLKFHPIGYESYDFVVRRDVLDSIMFKGFVEVLKSELFKRELDLLGGYMIEDAGQIIELNRKIEI